MLLNVAGKKNFVPVPIYSFLSCLSLFILVFYVSLCEMLFCTRGVVTGNRDVSQQVYCIERGCTAQTQAPRVLCGVFDLGLLA